MPAPVARPHALNASLADFGGVNWAEAVPPEMDRLSADLYTALVQKALDIPERERESDVLHCRQVDDLVRHIEVLERVSSWLDGAQPPAPPQAKLFC